MTVKATLVLELGIWGDVTLQKPLVFVVQEAEPVVPPLHEPLTFAFGMARWLESWTVMVTRALHLLPVHDDVPSRSLMWMLDGVEVGVAVGVDVGVLVAVFVGVEV